MNINYHAILPEIILSLGGSVIMLLDPLLKEARHKIWCGYVALLTVAVAIVVCPVSQSGTLLAFSDLIVQDSYGSVFKLIFLGIVASVLVLSLRYRGWGSLHVGEYSALLLFAGAGMCLLVASNDLVFTFLSLEILSIATYVLAGFRRDNPLSVESALKYFILGSFSTAILLFGAALVYGYSGTTRYLKIAAQIDTHSQGAAVLLAGLALILVGFGFKVAAAPFHVWAPDVYQGAPLPITVFLSVGSKAAAFAAAFRALAQAFPDLSSHWRVILWVGAVLTMTLGNIGALNQTNVKRLLAYSSIAHAGYILIGLTANNSLGTRGMVFYLLAYALMNIGAFAAVQQLSSRDERDLEIEQYAGLGFRYPLLGICFSVCLFSLAGFPSTAGFMGKLMLFGAAVQSKLYWLAIAGVLNSAIAVYYYLKVIVILFMKPPVDGREAPTREASTTGLLLVTSVATVVLGLFPGAILRWIHVL